MCIYIHIDIYFLEVFPLNNLFLQITTLSQLSTHFQFPKHLQQFTFLAFSLQIYLPIYFSKDQKNIHEIVPLNNGLGVV